MNSHHEQIAANRQQFGGATAEVLRWYLPILWRDRHHENDGARTLIRHKLRVIIGLLRDLR